MTRLETRLRDLIAALRERRWLAPMSAAEMNLRDEWLASTLEAMLTVASAEPDSRTPSQPAVSAANPPDWRDNYFGASDPDPLSGASRRATETCGQALGEGGHLYRCTSPDGHGLNHVARRQDGSEVRWSTPVADARAVLADRLADVARLRDDISPNQEPSWPAPDLSWEELDLVIAALRADPLSLSSRRAAEMPEAEQRTMYTRHDGPVNRATLAERAQWYRDGCPHLEDREGYWTSGDLLRDVASDLEAALRAVPEPAVPGLRDFLQRIVEYHGANDHHWLAVCAQGLLHALEAREAVPDPAGWQKAYAICEQHTPDVWEGDGTCVICEGHQFATRVMQLESALREIRAIDFLKDEKGVRQPIPVRWNRALEIARLALQPLPAVPSAPQKETP